jgi:hypothetical protein
MKILIIVLMIFLLAGLNACQNVITPQVNNTGPYEFPLEIVYPENNAPCLRLSSELPGMLRLIGCNSEKFVTGMIQYSESEFIPVIETIGNGVHISQNTDIVKGDESSPDYLNLWKMRVSDNKPFDLLINNLKAEGHWNFSGLPIKNLVVKAGTGKNAFTTDELNPVSMEKFNVTCSTGEVVVEGIMNAVIKNMQIDMEAGVLTLRFNGRNTRNKMDVVVRGGNGIIRVAIPEEISSTVQFTGGGNIIAGDGFRRVEAGSRDTYVNRAPGELEDTQISIKISSNSGPVYLESIPQNN